MKRWSTILIGAVALIHGMFFGAQFAMESPASAAQPAARGREPADDGKLRIVCFGAHPDDCELQIGGTAALGAAQGHHVKFGSVTNGDIGHWR